MNREEKRKWLSRYTGAKIRERELELEIEKLESEYILPSITIDDMPHGSGVDDLSTFGARFDELYRRIKAQKMHAMVVYGEIMTAIESAEADEVGKTILRYRYIQGRTMKQIAYEMHYSLRHVKRLHGECLDRMEIGGKR